MNRAKNLAIAATFLLLVCGSTSRLLAGNKFFRAVFPLPPEANATRSSVFALSESGNLLGWYEDTSGQTRYFFHDPMEDSYVVFDQGVMVSDLSDNLAVVGQISTGDLMWLGFYLPSPQLNPIPLPPLPGHTSSATYGVNDAGVVIGVSLAGTLESRKAVAWKVDADSETVLGPIELPSLPGDSWVNPNSIRQADHNGITLIAGESGDNLANRYSGVTWEVVDVGGELGLLFGPDDLGSLPGGDAYTFPKGVNQSDVLVGRSGNDAFAKHLDGPMAPLKKIKIKRKLAEQAEANAVNDTGYVVGWQYRYRGGHRAVVWTSPSRAYDLNRLVDLGRPGRLWSAGSINNANMILASGESGDESFGVLLIPN